MVTPRQRRSIEWVGALVFGVVMTVIDWHTSEPIFGIFSALALLLGIVASMSMTPSPAMFATMVVFWAFIGWVGYRIVRFFIVALRRSRAESETSRRR